MLKRWRINAIFLIFILFGAAIIGRLFFLQVIRRDYYRAMAQGQQGDLQALRGERGKIFFKGGEILATNVKKDYLFISPRNIRDKEGTAKMLSQLFDIDEASLLEKIKKK